MIIYFNLVFLYFMNPGLSSEVLDETGICTMVMIKGNAYISKTILLVALLARWKGKNSFVSLLKMYVNMGFIFIFEYVSI